MTDDSEITDWADRHVARWRDHWVDVDFDDDVEAMFVRMGRLIKHLKRHTQVAANQVGLEPFEYETLHTLMIRDTPGVASPTALAADLGVSPAGITGRLDTLEAAGWIQRHPVADDRRRVEIEATRAGVEIWRNAMDLRGREEDRLANSLTKDEREALNQLLKRLTLVAERNDEKDP